LSNIILVDVDGVLLDWERSFTDWMISHGFNPVEGHDKLYKVYQKFGLPRSQSNVMARYFNESAGIEHMPPLRDAVKYVRMLHEDHGYVFHLISSLSSDRHAQRLRTKNIKCLFGKTAFEKFIYLETGADKDKVLEEYKDTGYYWIEDKPANADAGQALGLVPILIAHEHNRHYKGHSVWWWKDIYSILTNRECHNYED